MLDKEVFPKALAADRIEEMFKADESADIPEYIRAYIAEKDRKLLQHPYFAECHAGKLSRLQMLETLKQIHCFSAYYERLITRRLATFRMNTNRDLLSTARHHLMEEIGHPDLFRACLIANGLSDGECDEIVPGTHTKALFGFLLATIDYEDEYVGSVAMLQAMESIGKIFFDATLASMRAVGMAADVFAAHSEADNDHAELGYDELADCDPYTIKDCIRVIDDIYVLMDHFLDQFI